jgi:hypothetical protein
MTANYVARVVESLYNKVDIDKMSEGFDKIEKYSCGRLSDDWVNRQITEKSYLRWLKACYLLETYLQHNYSTFVETELVYKWGKRICEQRNKDLSMYRAFGNPFGKQDFNTWLKKKELTSYY